MMFGSLTNEKKLLGHGARGHNGVHFNIGLFRREFLPYGCIELKYKYLQNAVWTGVTASRKSGSTVRIEEFRFDNVSM